MHKPLYRPQDYKTPRTLNEAFGPYSTLETEEPHTGDAWVMWACVLGAALIVAIDVFWS